MTTHLVTFSDDSMSRARDLCAESAWDPGGIRPADIHVFATEDIKEHFYTPHYRVYTQHRQIFDAPRGCGYWAWKPLFLHYHMYGPVVKEGDVIVYADAGVEFIAPVSHIIDRMDQDVFLFGNNWEHAHWCKRDVIEAVWPYWYEPQPVTDNPSPWGPEIHRTGWEKFGKQCQASVIFFRVSDYSRKFVAEWLKWCLHRERHSTICTDEWRYLIDDSPSILPNHPEFREHRHDQAILTTLAYREGIKLHYWPAQYNDGAFTYEKLPCYAGDDYPILFHHHRRRDHEWEKVA